MPLYADAEAVGGRLDAFDDAVGRGGVHDDAGRRIGGGLVVRAVHLEFVGADDAVKLRAPGHLHDMAGLVARIGLLVRQRIGDGVGDVLDQLAAQHDVQQLLAAADAEHRLVLRQGTLGHAELEGGAAILGDDRRVARAAAIVGGIDVERAAGHHQRVDTLEIVGDPVGLVRQRNCQTTRRVDRVEVVLAQRVPGKLGVSAWLFSIQGDSDEGTRHAAQDTRVRRRAL